MALSQIDDTFTASAELYVSGQDALEPLLRGLAVETDFREELEVLRLTLNNPDNLASVAANAGLVQQNGTSQQDILGEVGGALSVNQTTPSSVSISATHQDPDASFQIAEAALAFLLDNVINQSQEALASAQGFLDRQIQSYESQLAEADRRLTEFTAENFSISTTPELLFDQLRTKRDELAQTKADQLAAEKELEILEQRAERSIPVSNRRGFGPLFENLVDILAIESQINELRLRYTDNHPDILRLKRTLATLREAPPTTGAATESIGSSPSAESNEYSADIDSKKVQISRIKEIIALLEADIQEIEAVIKRTPSIEANIRELEENRDAFRRQLSDVIQRRDRAQLSSERNIEMLTGLNVRVLTRPTPPAAPDGFPRSALISAVLVFGIGSGIALSVLISLSRGTFYSASALSQAFRTPILGTISWAGVTAARGAFRTLLYSGIMLALIGTFMALLSIERNIGLPNLVTTYQPKLTSDLVSQLVGGLPLRGQ